MMPAGCFLPHVQKNKHRSFPLPDTNEVQTTTSRRWKNACSGDSVLSQKLCITRRNWDCRVPAFSAVDADTVDASFTEASGRSPPPRAVTAAFGARHWPTFKEYLSSQRGANLDDGHHHCSVDCWLLAMMDRICGGDCDRHWSRWPQWPRRPNFPVVDGQCVSGLQTIKWLMVARMVVNFSERFDGQDG
jgi:hypothetical protein